MALAQHLLPVVFAGLIIVSEFPVCLVIFDCVLVITLKSHLQGHSAAEDKNSFSEEEGAFLPPPMWGSLKSKSQGWRCLRSLSVSSDWVQHMGSQLTYGVCVWSLLCSPPWTLRWLGHSKMA